MQTEADQMKRTKEKSRHINNLICVIIILCFVIPLLTIYTSKRTEAAALETNLWGDKATAQGAPGWTNSASVQTKTGTYYHANHSGLEDATSGGTELCNGFTITKGHQYELRGWICTDGSNVKIYSQLVQASSINNWKILSSDKVSTNKWSTTVNAASGKVQKVKATFTAKATVSNVHWFIAGADVNLPEHGSASNYGTWFWYGYAEVLDTGSYPGVIQNSSDHQWYYYNSSAVKTGSYTGIAHRVFNEKDSSGNVEYYYVHNGKVNWGYNGIIYGGDYNEFFYMENSKWIKKETLAYMPNGLQKNGSTWDSGTILFYVSKEGKYQASKNGTYTFGGCTYTLVNGQAQKTIKFHANGAENKNSTTTDYFEKKYKGTKDEKLPLTADVLNQFNRPGYTFAGWNTKADGTGTTYGGWNRDSDGNRTTEITYAPNVSNSSITRTSQADIQKESVYLNSPKFPSELYAIWEPNSVEVTFDPNGGTLITDSSKTYTSGVEQYFPDTGAEYPGYELAGWAETADAAEAKWSVNGDKVEDKVEDSWIGEGGTRTVYAVWKYSIAFDPNESHINSAHPEVGHTGESDTADMTDLIKGQTYTLSPNTWYVYGLDFVGWSTGADTRWQDWPDTGDDLPNGKLSDQREITGNPAPGEGSTCTLYAVWKPVEYKISYKSVTDDRSEITVDTDTGLPSGASCRNKLNAFYPANGGFSIGNPTVAGYRFTGWECPAFSESGKTGQIMNFSVTDNDVYALVTTGTLADTITMTAHFEKVPGYNFVVDSTAKRDGNGKVISGDSPMLKETSKNKGRFRIEEIQSSPGYVYKDQYHDIDITDTSKDYYSWDEVKMK